MPGSELPAVGILRMAAASVVVFPAETGTVADAVNETLAPTLGFKTVPKVKLFPTIP